MAETGFARGTLSPIYYFEDSKGHLVMPVYDAGRPEQARRVYEESFKARGYDWKTASTLKEWQDLEARLIRQELFKKSLQLAKFQGVREQVTTQVRSNLRHRMVSASTSQWEKDFIAAWIKLNESKRPKYETVLNDHNYYLWALQMDSGTKIDDRMPMQPGEFWRPE